MFVWPYHLFHWNVVFLVAFRSYFEELLLGVTFSSSSDRLKSRSSEAWEKKERERRDNLSCLSFLDFRQWFFALHLERWIAISHLDISGTQFFLGKWVYSQLWAVSSELSQVFFFFSFASALSPKWKANGFYFSPFLLLFFIRLIACCVNKGEREWEKFKF